MGPILARFLLYTPMSRLGGLSIPPSRRRLPAPDSADFFLAPLAHVRCSPVTIVTMVTVFFTALNVFIPF